MLYSFESFRIRGASAMNTWEIMFGDFSLFKFCLQTQNFTFGLSTEAPRRKDAIEIENVSCKVHEEC